jgi:hypothetical protein
MGSLQHTDGGRPLALRQYRPNTFTGHSKACASMERTRAHDGLRPRSRYPHQTPYQHRRQAMILTEHEIEMFAERAMDRLDKQLLSNQIQQEQYDRDIVSLDKWAEQQYQHAKDAK